MKSEWRRITLGEVCRFQAGNVFPRKEQGKISGDIPFIKVSDMNLSGNERKIYKSNNWISTNYAKQIKINLAPPGAIVFAKIGEALKANRLRELTRYTAIDNNMMAAIPNSNIEDGFLRYILENINFAHYAEGSALPYLRQKDLEAIYITLPSRNEQKRIVSIIQKIDSKIEINNRINDNLAA